MKAYFINLDRSPERLAYMSRTLNALGIDHERVAAVDGNTLSDEEIGRNYTHRAGTQLLDAGSIACFMSHRRAWQRIAEGEDDHALVLEDDIVFGRDAGALLRDMSWIPDGAPLVRLETFRRHTVWDAEPLARAGDREIVRLRHVQLGAGAYVISRRAAGLLTERTPPFRHAVDFVLFDPRCPDFCGFEIMQMIPAPCIQSDRAPADTRPVDLPSILQQTRRKVLARGFRRLLAKTERELSKQRLKWSGLIFDRFRGTKTGRIPFR
ncbi:glycosyltransferase family 25 protein [Oricola thermophila]|uniref:Glycosyltransferase family 25 protein n=1 Tax=Oricola thermophila TaxID=2742145 RepID=A0A6N1VGM3_9HYPH|nr:glycosyltransferase family 25 protein [Oricola thermophila]QKV18815.1 glycosyltransferase family 25 protein [Oricola thermophila]